MKHIYRDWDKINQEESHITNSEKNKFIKDIKFEIGSEMKQYYSKPKEIKKLGFWDKLKRIFNG